MDNCCKYCNKALEELTNEGLQCDGCSSHVHLTCLKRGSTPGALIGDVFFKFTCLECSDSDAEVFIRDSQRWFQVLVLAFYHLNVKHKALSRNGFYHWKMHICTFIDKNWDIIYGRTLKQKKNWMGTVSGLLSIHSPAFFTKCTGFSDQGWWSLTYPKLTPSVTVKLASELTTMKASLKAKQQNFFPESLLVKDILQTKSYDDEYKQEATGYCVLEDETVAPITTYTICPETIKPATPKLNKNKRSLLPTLETFSKQMDLFGNGTPPPRKKQKLDIPVVEEDIKECHAEDKIVEDTSSTKLLDPMCHYNTSINNLFMLKRMTLKTKLLGGLREEPILSPYSNLYLKPYIHRDGKNMPHWLKLMAQIQQKANDKVTDYVLPPRGPIDYVYVQPSHIPAINSLCNEFFWPGIDLTECLQYPDFTCVAMYKRLIVGFAFIVPDVKVHENYISFIFVRPGWRNIGIARFMVYHLIQTSMGKDITLHVAINNPALLLYQKFGFKVEHVELNFYDKYLRTDSYESKHAFFCRLER